MGSKKTDTILLFDVDGTLTKSRQVRFQLPLEKLDLDTKSYYSTNHGFKLFPVVD